MNPQHLTILEAGRDVWNSWRDTNPAIQPDLSGAFLWGRDLAGFDLSKVNFQKVIAEKANLKGASLAGADLRKARCRRALFPSAVLQRANLRQADLRKANFNRANLDDAILSRADLRGATFRRATLRRTNLHWAHVLDAVFAEAEMYKVHLEDSNVRGADFFKASMVAAKFDSAKVEGARFTSAVLDHAFFYGARVFNSAFVGATMRSARFKGATIIGSDFTGANLARSNLKQAYVLDSRFTHANLSESQVFGVATWRVDLTNAEQQDLVISDRGEPRITVDNIGLAQFVYFLLRNENVRSFIDTITSKVVVVLGRFTPAYKIVLDRLREGLRQRGFLPVVFDFDKPAHRDTMETVSTLAHMARFVIADLSRAKSVLQELQRIVPALPSVPVQPLIMATESEPGMIDHFRQFPWFLELCVYRDIDSLIQMIDDDVIGPAHQIVIARQRSQQEGQADA